jgi:hypothetical protein
MITRLASTFTLAPGCARSSRSIGLGPVGRVGHLGVVGLLAVVAAGAGALGCLNVPDPVAPMCQSTNDCDRSHGEVCEEGVCWGNPPPGPFAAVVSPPSTRQDLVSREIPQVAIPDFGWMGDLALEAPVLLSGRIVAFCPPTLAACDQTPLAGTVTVTRRSQFHGGPGFKAVVDVAAGDAFAIPVPRTHVDDDLYTVTILPQSSLDRGTHTAAELVPPLRMQVAVIDNTSTQQIPLGGAALPAISGTLTDSLGAPISGYRVSALGRWDPTEPATEVSTISFTDSMGRYSVMLSDALAGPVELIARPTGGVVGPTVHIANVDSSRSSTRPIALLSNLGGTVELDITVMGLNASGTVSPVSGALVSVSGATPPSQLTMFTIADQKTTNDRGVVALHLLNGDGIANTYHLAITPPASSPLSVIFDQRLPALTGLARLVLPPTRLGARVALRGKVFDAGHNPLANAVVTARPSLRFLWTLEPAPQAFVSAIPAAVDLTRDTGDFIVWVDANLPSVAQSWGSYDLSVEPSTNTRAPAYVVPAVDTRNGPADAITVPDVTLPEPAYVHGRVTGPDGQSVEGAELKLYLISTQLTLCSEVAHAPASCPIPSQLEARNTSDKDGTVRLILPR